MASAEDIKAALARLDTASPDEALAALPALLESVRDVLSRPVERADTDYDSGYEAAFDDAKELIWYNLTPLVE